MSKFKANLGYVRLFHKRGKITCSLISVRMVVIKKTKTANAGPQTGWGEPLLLVRLAKHRTMV